MASLPQTAKTPQHRWVQGTGDRAHELYLFDGALQIGGYDTKAKVYRHYDAFKDKWGPVQTHVPDPREVKKEAPKKELPKCKCKIEGWKGMDGRQECDECTCTDYAQCEFTGANRPNFGILLDKVNESGSHYSHNGKEVDRQTAHALVTGQLTDDSGKLWVTVIGPPIVREPVEKALKHLPADLQGAFSVKSYDASHWAVKDAGFVTSGSPTVYCQAPGGKVLHRQDDFADGPDGLFTALRKAKGGYDAKKDPDLRKGLPDFLASLDLKKMAPCCFLVMAILGVSALNLKRRK